MRELSQHEMCAVSGGMGDRTADASMAIMQETPNLGFFVGSLLLTATGPLGAGFALAANALSAWGADFK